MNSHPVVLYASMSGNSRDCALHLGQRLRRSGHSVDVINLADYDPSRILNERMVFVCISTWEEGEAPYDGEDFLEFLRFLDAGTLAHVSYSVLALGDSRYPDFCECGRNVDALFEYLGAKRVTPRVDCDLQFESGAKRWAGSIISALKLRPVAATAIAA